MQNGENHPHHHSGTEVVGSSGDDTGLSGPLMSGPLMNKRGGGGKIARFNIPADANPSGDYGSSSGAISNDDIAETTLDIRDDSVAFHSVVKTVGGGADVEDPELTLSAGGLEKKPTSGASRVRNASSRIRQVSQEFKRLASRSKRPHAAKFDRTKSAAAQALKGLRFISKTDGGDGWANVRERFIKLTEKTNGLLPRELFGECIGMKESQNFALELFDALARRRHFTGDLVDQALMRELWDQITDQSFDSRLYTFFDMVDKNEDGRITEDEIREIITLSASANKLSIIQKQAGEYAAFIMEELDPHHLGYISIEELEMLLLQAPSHSARDFESKVLSKMLSQRIKRPRDSSPLRRCCEDFKYFLLDNWQRVWVVALWIGAMAGLFAYKYVQYRNKAVFDVTGHCVCMAKGAAETLKLNMALILLPVCRNTITWFRNKTKLGAAVPFDDTLSFHKLIATAIALGIGIHGISHLACDFPRLLHATPEEYELMEQYFGDQPTNYWWFVKGFEGVSGIVMVVLMAIAFTLATPWFRRDKFHLPKPFNKVTGFNAFWYSHHLFVIVYALLIAHGIKLYLTKEWYEKTTWMYLAVPVALYAGERLTRTIRSSIKDVQILRAAVYPEDGDLLALHMSKPVNFRYKSGQYMFVKCAAVSPFEWHPFSISSAPGDDHLSVHIRSLGDWTRQIRNVFSKECQESPGGVLRADILQGENKPNFPKVSIDGPYGAPAQVYQEYRVVLLVGLGIGATPMISIVKDIVNNMRAMEEDGYGANPSPPNAQKRKSGSATADDFKTRKAYFYWVTREQGSFDWFKGIMNEVAELDKQEAIEMHVHSSSVYEEGDARSALITMLQSLHRAKNGVDVISGARIKTHFGRPSWKDVYNSIAVNHTNARVGVFYCGKPTLTDELRQLALDFSHKSSTKFDFHTEHF